MIGIFGANGFIGRHLAQRLQSRGRKFKAISRHFTPDFVAAHGGSAELVEANFADPLAMVSALDGLDTVVQLVSTSSPGMQNLHSVADIRENVIPHVAFLQTCVAAGVRRYVFLSSGGTVYGPTNDVPIREDSETNPISSHGLTKLMVEKYIQMHGRVDGLDYVILRLAKPFGPGQHYRTTSSMLSSLPWGSPARRAASSTSAVVKRARCRRYSGPSRISSGFVSSGNTWMSGRPTWQ